MDVDYIVICTGDEDLNAEIAGELQSTLTRLGGDADIFQVSYDNIIHLKNKKGEEPQLIVSKLYTREFMDIHYADKVAMSINHIYCKGESAEADWNKTKFFDRMSSRASADFAPAFMKMTGITKEELITTDKWKELSEVQLENLSKTEHLRWNAFHYSMGYSRMSDEVFKERCDIYHKDIEEKGRSSVKIQKDQNKYQHICLVDWDELDEISEKYRQVTGDLSKDYKKDDTNNVMMLAEVIKNAESLE